MYYRCMIVTSSEGIGNVALLICPIIDLVFLVLAPKRLGLGYCKYPKLAEHVRMMNTIVILDHLQLIFALRPHVYWIFHCHV